MLIKLLFETFLHHYDLKQVFFVYFRALQNIVSLLVFYPGTQFTMFRYINSHTKPDFAKLRKWQMGCFNSSNNTF